MQPIHFDLNELSISNYMSVFKAQNIWSSVDTVQPNFVIYVIN